MNIKERFDECEDEFLQFNNITNKMATRRDVHAFMLLDKLLPLDTDKPHCGDMVVAVEHDQIWLDVNMDDFDKVATYAIILELCRCGVQYDDDVESLTMFV